MSDPFARHFSEALRAIDAAARPDEPELEPRRFRRLHRAFVELGAGFLYGVQWLWSNLFNVLLIIAVTAWTGYWATAWIYLVIDRSRP